MCHDKRLHSISAPIEISQRTDVARSRTKNAEKIRKKNEAMVNQIYTECRHVTTNLVEMTRLLRRTKLMRHEDSLKPPMVCMSFWDNTVMWVTGENCKIIAEN